MSDLPKGWKVNLISDTFELVRDKGLSGVAPYLEIGNVNINNKKYTFTDKKSVKGCKKAIKGDVLISRVRPTRGAIAQVKEKSLEVSSAFTILRNTYGFNEKYLWYYLAWNDDYLNYLGFNCTGTMYPTVPENIAVNYKISIAPLNEQRRIVAKLEKLLHRVDACKERLNKIPAILKRFRQSVLAAACSGKLTADWRGKYPEGELQKKYLKECHSRENGNPENSITLDSCFRRIDEDQLPDTWGCKRLSDVADVKGGVTKGRKFNGKKTIFLPYLRVANVQDGYLDLTEIKQIEVLPEDKTKYALKDGDLLFTEGGDRDKLGRGTVWRGEIQDCIHQNHIFRARLTARDAIPDYVSITTKSDFSKRYFFENASQTVNLASINIRTLSALPLPLPPLNEQQEIVRRVNALFKKAGEIEARYKKAKAFVDKLTQSILAKAFRGELVPQDPNDEPALKLLEKIKVEKAKQGSKRNNKKRQSL